MFCTESIKSSKHVVRFQVNLLIFLVFYGSGMSQLGNIGKVPDTSGLIPLK